MVALQGSKYWQALCFIGRKTMSDVRKENDKFLSELCEVARDLVWYAESPFDVQDGVIYAIHPIKKIRVPIEETDIPKATYTPAVEALARIEKAYPAAIEDMDYGPPNWQIGFNNGLLAGLRLAIGLNTDSLKRAIVHMRTFPELDT